MVVEELRENFCLRLVEGLKVDCPPLCTITVHRYSISPIFEDLACAKFDQVLATAARAAREISMIAFCCSIKLAIL